MRIVAVVVILVCVVGYGCGQSAPPIAIPDSPQDGCVALTLTPTLTWTGSDNIDYYQLQVATDDSFLNTIIDETGIIEPSYTIMTDTLEYGKKYYWRINAYRNERSSGWSHSWTLTVQNPSNVSISVLAVTDKGKPLDGVVKFTLSGPTTVSGTAPSGFTNMTPGTYTLDVLSGFVIGVISPTCSILPSRTLHADPADHLIFTVIMNSGGRPLVPEELKK